MQVIAVVDEVPMSKRRQVPMIQEMQKGQKSEEVQISFKVYVDHAKDGQNDAMNCMKGAPHFVLTSNSRTDKVEVRKRQKRQSSRRTVVNGSR